MKLIPVLLRTTKWDIFTRANFLQNADFLPYKKIFLGKSSLYLYTN